MIWRPVHFPQRPRLPDDSLAPDGVLERGQLPVVIADDAIVTPRRRGPLRRCANPNRWIRGAVHTSEGRLVLGSQRVDGGGLTSFAAADPWIARAGPNAVRLAGTWLYGGQWFEHFGHFMCETLTNLWHRPTDPVDGLLFHPGVDGSSTVTDLQREFLALAGFGDLAIGMVDNHGLLVERVIVPSRPFVASGWAHPEAVDVWRGVSRAAQRRVRDRSTIPSVFMSRSNFHARQAAAGKRVRSSPARDQELDSAFAAAGFHVVSPESLALVDQIAIAADAEVIAGPAGSALHLAAFASRPLRVLELGDSRNKEIGLRNQQVINAACGHRHRFVPVTEPIHQVLADVGLFAE